MLLKNKMLQKLIPLSQFSNYKIGGPAEYFYEFKNKDDIRLAIDEYKRIDPELVNVFILGEGTNILFSDEGFNGLILKNSIKSINYDKGILVVSSGVLFSDLNDFAIKNSIRGFEWSGGLPGSVGGAVRGNAGAHGGETKDNIVEVVSFDYKKQETVVRSDKDCLFDYRNSIFKSGEAASEIILSAKFRVDEGVSEKIQEETNKKIEFRKERHPLEYPNLGSTFKNIPVEKVSTEILDEFRASIKKDPFFVLPAVKLIVGANLVSR